MNEYQKIIIGEQRDRILQDLTHIDEIVVHLRASKVIGDNDRENIYRSANKGAKLLDILLKKPDGIWFDEFCKALGSDYPWIRNDLLDAFNSEADKKKEFYLNIRGSVPLLPQRNVYRTQYVEQLREGIDCLKRSNYIIVHGMSGCGKTSLASNALNSIHLLETAFRGCVYWFSVGHLTDTETAGELRCQELQKKLCEMVGLTANPQRDLLSQLKHFFASHENYYALLVLDNVVSSNVIKALDIGCKTLVTTNDLGVVTDVKSRCQLFPVVNGFLESESVQLLTDFVTDGKGRLPHKIRQCAINIHQTWKGQPMVIGLIGGHLAEKSEEALNDEACWKEFEKNPSQESNCDFASRRRSLVEQQITSIIAKAIDKLEPDLKVLYQMLVVFVEDANITSEVLGTLWSKHPSDAEIIINTFCRRSLAVKKHHPYLKVWVYGIHAMLVANLKEKVSSEDLRKMHEELLWKYTEKCKGDFSLISDKDNYFFTYICHHIEEAREWDKYRDQFFTLHYLESKLQATGPGDFLLDLHKYQDGLVGDNQNYKKHIKDIVKFVESSGWEIYKNKMDLIQCALLEATDSIVHSWALEKAKNEQPAKCYFFSLNNPRGKPKEIEFPIPNVKAVCIIPSTSSDGRVLVVPDDKGWVAEVDMRFRSKRRVFEVSSVCLLNLSKYQDKFLSGSEDGFVKIWSLASENATTANTPPPSMRQRNYENLQFSESRTVPTLFKKHDRSVTCASFSHDGKHVVSASAAGDVFVWNVETDKEEKTISVHPSPLAVSCAFLFDNNMIVYGCLDHQIYFYDVRAGQVKVREETDRNLGRIISILPLADAIRKIIIVQLKGVSMWSWDAQILIHQADGGARRTELRGLRKQLFHEETSNFTCAAYAERRLVLGTSKHGCLFFNIDNIDDFLGKEKYSCIGSGLITSVDLSRDRLVYSTSTSVRMCWLEMGNSFSNLNQDSVVCLGWNNKDVSVYASAPRSKILVFHDGKIIMDRIVLKEISILCISPDGEHVAAGCGNGEVISLDTVSHALGHLSSLPSKVTFLQCKVWNNDVVFVAAADPTCCSGTENDGKNKHYLEVINKRRSLKLQCPGLSSAVISAFVDSSLLIVVLCDYSIMVWNISFNCRSSQPVAHHVLQEGRRSARVTGVGVAKDKKFLVISDEEKCFHVVSIDWPEVCKRVDVHEGIDKLKLFIPSSAYGISQSLSSTNVEKFRSSSVDEVDGGVNSTFSVFPSTSMSTFELLDPAWCCDVSCDGKLIALGCGVNKVCVWNSSKKMEIAEFEVPSNSNVKVSHLLFSNSIIKLANKSYQSVLLVVTDCFSLWDLSPPFVSLTGFKNEPSLLGCVKAGGLPFVEVSVNSSFSKFSGVDSSGTYFLWEVK